LRLFSFGGYGLALAALALVVFGAIGECPPIVTPLKVIQCLNRAACPVSSKKKKT